MITGCCDDGHLFWCLKEIGANMELTFIRHVLEALNLTETNVKQFDTPWLRFTALISSCTYVETVLGRGKVYVLCSVSYAFSLQLTRKMFV